MAELQGETDISLTDKYFNILFSVFNKQITQNTKKKTKVYKQVYMLAFKK